MQLVKVHIDQKEVLQKLARKTYSDNFGTHWEGEGLELYLESQFGDEQLKQDLVESNVDYYFITYNNLPVGFIKVNLNATLQGVDKIESAELEKLYLLTEFKRIGLGKTAMHEIIQDLKIKGKKLIFLCVIETNNKALAFYKAIGFKFHSKCRLEVPFFKEEMRGMHQLVMEL